MTDKLTRGKLTLFHDLGVRVQWKPTAQLEPYVLLQVQDKDDGMVVGVDFRGGDAESLRHLATVLKDAADLLGGKPT